MNPAKELDDDALERRLYEAAAAGDSTAALAALDAAVRRRLGAWRAALLPAELLDGAAGEIRRRADGGETPTPEDDPPTRAALGWLREMLARMRLEHPSEIRLPADAYRALWAVDDAGALRFEPTRQQMEAAELLLTGAIVEMDAGDGKTLASAIAAALFAASGRRAHVLTANDYLANRDCEALAPLFESLGITVGLVASGMDRGERRMQYAAQVVFATAREVGFDWLRDRVAASPAMRVGQRFDVAIADEADHLLIDQARTPLIISGDAAPDAAIGADSAALADELIERQARYVDRMYERIEADRSDTRESLAAILLAGGLTPRLAETLDGLGIPARQTLADAARLNDAEDGSPLERDLLFAVDAERRALRLTDLGWQRVFEREDSPRAAFETAQLISARILHSANADYVVGDDGITLVDRLDGRPLEAHRYMHGLHEALEAKEGVDGVARANPKAMTTIRALMSNYVTVCGLTGTAMEAAEAFARDYAATAVRVPSETPSRRVDLGSRVWFDRESHLSAIVDEAERWQAIGRPALIAVATVAESRRLSGALAERGISHSLLDAANPESETSVVESAGAFGALTVSTGMAGRGADIVVDDYADERIIRRAAARARRLLDAGKAAAFECASEAEARLLKRALPSDWTIERSGAGGWEVGVSACKLRAAESVERIPFGLGLVVVIASLPASARVERQLRGRTARQGGFGAAAMRLYVNDAALAFSRRQRELLDMRREGAEFVEGRDVERVLRSAQTDAETESAAAARGVADLSAVIESESRAYYAERERLMASRQPPNMAERMASEWAERRTADLYDARTDYETRFGIVSDGLWFHHGIDIEGERGATPADARRALSAEAGARLAFHRGRLGARRLALAAADAKLSAMDDLWPLRLAAAQDMALSAALGASSRGAAAAALAELAAESRDGFLQSAEDDAIRRMIAGADVARRAPMGDNRIEELPDELYELLS